VVARFTVGRPRRGGTVSAVRRRSSVIKGDEFGRPDLSYWLLMTTSAGPSENVLAEVTACGAASAPTTSRLLASVMAQLGRELINA
jgi:hypothetical protein